MLPELRNDLLRRIRRHPSDQAQLLSIELPQTRQLTARLDRTTGGRTGANPDRSPTEQVLVCHPWPDLRTPE
jgi:hypothetical protein